MGLPISLVKGTFMVKYNYAFNMVKFYITTENNFGLYLKFVKSAEMLLQRMSVEQLLCGILIDFH